MKKFMLKNKNLLCKMNAFLKLSNRLIIDALCNCLCSKINCSDKNLCASQMKYFHYYSFLIRDVYILTTSLKKSEHVSIVGFKDKSSVT